MTRIAVSVVAFVVGTIGGWGVALAGPHEMRVEGHAIELRVAQIGGEKKITPIRKPAPDKKAPSDGKKAGSGHSHGSGGGHSHGGHHH